MECSVLVVPVIVVGVAVAVIVGVAVADVADVADVVVVVVAVFFFVVAAAAVFEALVRYMQLLEASCANLHCVMLVRLIVSCDFVGGLGAVDF